MLIVHVKELGINFLFKYDTAMESSAAGKETEAFKNELSNVESNVVH